MPPMVVFISACIYYLHHGPNISVLQLLLFTAFAGVLISLKLGVTYGVGQHNCLFRCAFDSEVPNAELGDIS
jgi:hypothetical protein